jgi:hypothetical protein
MKAFFVLRLLLLIVASCPLFAHAASCFSARVELLYFTPSYDETYFVINGTGGDGAGNPTPSGKRINNPVGYQLGFRLEGICCPLPFFDFGLRWTHLQSSSAERVFDYDIPAQLWPIAVIPNLPNVPMPFSGEATSQIGIMYQKAEFLLEEKIWKFRFCHIALREAVEWSYVRYNEKVEYTSVLGTERTHFHGHTKGIGPQLGAIVFLAPGEICSWPLRNIAFRLMTTGSLIAANSKAKIKATDILSGDSKVTQLSFWRLVPEWCVDFRVQYGLTRGFVKALLEIGYEMTLYFRGTSKLIFNEIMSPGVSFNQYSDFYVHGVVASISVSL